MTTTLVVNLMPFQLLVNKKKSRQGDTILQFINSLTFKTFILLLYSLLFYSKSYAQLLDLSIQSNAAILVDEKSGNILYQKNAFTPHYPASITKIATALYALHKKSDYLDEIIAADQEAIGSISSQEKKRRNYKTPSYWIEHGSTHIGIKKGEELSLRVLLYGMLIESGNDAANVIAHYVAGSIPKFMDELNAYIKTLGCQRTHFTNPHGLHHPEHITCAYDMILITREALKSPIFREIISTTNYRRPQTNKQPSVLWSQSNHLLHKGSQHYYPYAIGVKTGYTSHAKHCFVGAAEKSDRKLICVLLGAPELKDKFNDAITLFNAAFNEKKVTRVLMKQSERQFTRSIPRGQQAISAALTTDISITYYPTEEPEIKAELRWNEKVVPPVEKGSIVGEVCIINIKEDKILNSYPIVAVENVQPTIWFQLQQFWQNLNLSLFSIFAYIGIFLSSLFAFLYIKGRTRV
ncbi:MAG: D-alanyl-D-alanine carboxypeptidase dacF [Chlamydiales bacterium]|nr:D-alanyl-D-alanine carboxypeptidase dacF [Chlamydiales bacterium]